MVHVRDAFLDTEDFDFQINSQGVVQLSFGPTHVCMTLDSAYDMQYRLAAFLAHLEVGEYPEEVENEEPRLTQSRQSLKDMASTRKSKRLDA